MSFKLIATLTVIVIALFLSLTIAVAIVVLPVFFAPIGGMGALLLAYHTGGILNEIWTLKVAK